MATKSSKQIAKGTPRKRVSWGKVSKQVKVKGVKKKIAIEYTSFVFDSVIKTLGLPVATTKTAAAAKVVNSKNKKGVVSSRLSGGRVPRVSGGKVVMMSTGSYDTEGSDKGKLIWHQITVPSSCSIATIVKALKKSKVYMI
jgi:hypothetical protein